MTIYTFGATVCKTLTLVVPPSAVLFLVFQSSSPDTEPSRRFPRPVPWLLDRPSGIIVEPLAYSFGL